MLGNSFLCTSWMSQRDNNGNVVDDDKCLMSLCEYTKTE